MSPQKRLPEHKGLPARWRFKNGAYRYQVPPGQRAAWDGKAEFTLGRTLPEAYRAWADRVGAQKATTLGALVDRYLLEVTPTKRPASRRGDIRNAVTVRKRFGHFGLTEIEPHHVYEYVSKRGALTAAHREIELLSHALTWAVQWGLIKSHPFKGEVRFERSLQPQRKQRYVEDSEIVAALAIQSRRKRGSVRMMQAYIRLKLVTGLRQTDLLMLRSGDAKEDGIHVTPSKTKGTTGRSQIFAWTPERRGAWAAALAARPKDIAPNVFCTNRGEGYFDEETGRASGFSSVWQRFMTRVAKETGIRRFAERDLRAKVGSDAETLERARRILGHADTRTTLTFYRRKAEVIE
jgi:integrase